MRYLFLRVSGRNEFPLGSISSADEIPELLRYVADYYDDNPEACAEHFTAGTAPSPLHFIDAGQVFGSSSTGSPATPGR